MRREEPITLDYARGFRQPLGGGRGRIGSWLCIGAIFFVMGASWCNAQCVAYLVPLSVPVYKNAEGGELWKEHRAGFLLALPGARRDYRPESYVKVQEWVERDLTLPMSAGCLPTSFKRSAAGRVKVFVSKPATGYLEVAWVPEKECIAVSYAAPAGLTIGMDVQSAAENLGVIREAALKTLGQRTPESKPTAAPAHR